MIAGTLGILEDTVTARLKSKNGGGFTTLDVQGRDEYLDGAAVQYGRACSTVESTQEEIHVLDGEIEVESVGTKERVWTEWVADVTDAGFVVAERTHSENPMFPFDLFRAATGETVDPARIDPGAFVRQQDDVDLWFSGSKAETPDTEPNDVDMGYGRDANQAGGNVGVGFETGWNGTTVRGVMYASGYVAVYNDTWGPMQFARFVRDAILPVAHVPDTEEGTEQDTLEETEEPCPECGREVDGDAELCIVCQDAAEERGEA